MRFAAHWHGEATVWWSRSAPTQLCDFADTADESAVDCRHGLAGEGRYDAEAAGVSVSAAARVGSVPFE